MSSKVNRKHGTAIFFGVFALLAILAVELTWSVRQQSQTVDEAAHILAGYRYWTASDFGMNPEHPPLVKLVAALPLLGLPLQVPSVPNGYFKTVEYVSGQQFLYANDADRILFRARMAVAIFSVGLTLSVFLVGRRMFGTGPALLALVLLVFEPTLLAYGALVATDVAVACGFFLSVYALYLYVRKPSAARILVLGLVLGLTLGAKHSGVLVLPMLACLLSLEAAGWLESSSTWGRSFPEFTKRIARHAGALAVAAGFAVLVLWALYGFRFQLRPAGLAMSPTLAEFAPPTNHPIESRMVTLVARSRVLPEAYIYGLVDIGRLAKVTPTFLLGHVYAQGRWFYFPVAFAIKSTIGLLLLLCLLPFARALRDHKKRLEIAFLLIPCVAYLLIAMASGLNLGIRHLMPIYPFLFLLVGYAASGLATQSRRWAYAVALLLVLHVTSSLRAFPTYIPYANAAFGGTNNTYRLLAESNVDVGQGLKALKQYVDEHHVADCWFADYAIVVAADPAYYGIPCRPLPTALNRYFATPMAVIPQIVEGTIFVSAGEASGRLWGPGEMNPYIQFYNLHPVDTIAGSILVFKGRFDVSQAAAITHANRAMHLAQENKLEDALGEARTAAALAPGNAGIQMTMGSVLERMNKTADARRAYQTALSLAEVYPEYQRSSISGLQSILAQMNGS